MADIEQNYYAFLSCSPEDNRGAQGDSPVVGRRDWGNWLEAALKAYVIPPELVGQINGRGEIIPERITSVFRDESELSEAVGLSAEVRHALEQSNCLIVICSPRAAQSRQVNAVVSYFKQLGRTHQILPFVIAGTPNASNSHQPGSAGGDECYVPALRHPVKSDGTVDTTRLASKHAFVEARYGAEKREILAQDHRSAAAELERAKIQLIALLLGVGFDLLWARQQKFHFFELMEAQEKARETLNQVVEVRQQLHDAQHQTREIQRQALEQQNLPRAVQEQIHEAQNQAVTAQQQARVAQEQLQEVQNKVRETQAQLEEARSRALVAESKVLEAQQAARESQSQLEMIRHQVRTAEQLASEVQDRTQSEQVQQQILAAQREAQSAQGQLEEARQQAQDAQNKLSVAQGQAQEFQNQAQAAQSQLAEARQQVREAQGKVVAAEQQAREALQQVQETQKQTQNAQSQIKVAQDQAREIQSRDQQARRLTKVFAVLAALALLAVGVVARNAWQQRQLDRQALAKATAEASGTFELSAGGEPVRQVLQKIGGAEQAENRRRSLDRLAAGIPTEEIPEVLQAAAVLLDAQQRSQFQKSLLVRLGAVNPSSAMTNASAVAGEIVNDRGERDSVVYFQLAVLDQWMQSDWAGAFNWVCQLPNAGDRQRALEKLIRVVQAQPDSEAKQQRLVKCIGVMARTDLYGALAVVESLPSEQRFGVMIACVWTKVAPVVVRRLGVPPEIMASREASWVWPFSISNTVTNHPVNVPTTTEALPQRRTRRFRVSRKSKRIARCPIDSL